MESPDMQPAQFANDREIIPSSARCHASTDVRAQTLRKCAFINIKPCSDQDKCSMSISSTDVTKPKLVVDTAEVNVEFGVVRRIS